MSLSGAGLMGFVLVHLLGNLTLFVDPTGEAFDKYAFTLESSPLLPFAEIGLAVLFAVHIALGVRVALDNREARPVRYKDLEAHGQRTLSSTTMIVTGLLILIFLVVHLWDFRLAERDRAGLAAMVVHRLSRPLAALLYVVGVAALGIHLWHAFQSAFQSLGLNHPQYRPLIRKTGRAFAVVIALGFVAFPIGIFVAPQSWAQRVSEEAAGDSAPDPTRPSEPPTAKDSEAGALR